MTLEKKAVKSIFWSFLERWAGQLISTSVFLLLARLLGPEAFGLAALASVYISLMSAFVNQGFVPAIVQKDNLTPSHLDTAFWSSLSIGSVMYLGTFVSSGLIAQIFGEPDLQAIIKWLALIFPIIAFESVQTAILQRNFDFKKLAIRSLLATFVSGIAGAIMAFWGFGVWSLVVQQLTNRVMNVLVLWQTSSWRPSWNVVLADFKELSAFGVNVMGVNILKFFNQRSDDFLIGMFLGTTALGYYTVAYRLLRLMVNVLTNTTVSVALPAFSRIQNEPQRLRKAFYKVTRLTSFISFPAFFGVIFLAPELVSVLFGDKWVQSISVMRVLALVGILQSISYFNGTVMMAKGKPDWRLKINFINALLNVLGFAITVKFGIVAVAISVVVSNYLVAPIYLWAIRKLITIDLGAYFQQYFTALLSAGLMTLVMLAIKVAIVNFVSEFSILFICGISGILTYLVIVLMIDREMLKQILTMVRQIMK